MTEKILRAAIRATVLDGVTHAFFTRQGGVSEGVYATLNGGVGSSDDPAAVAENRARMARALGVAPENFLVPYQIHSADALAVSAPWPEGERPRCDGLVTATPGLALGVTGADCGVLLFADKRAGVIGAAHSGWKGALTGMVEALVAAMEALGARRGNIAAALGPTIAQQSYEVGPEFFARFEAEDAGFARFFAPSAKPDHFLFDLPGLIEMRAERARIGAFENLRLDTYSDEARFYSYRRKTHRGEPDYGRLIAAIALPE
ncbi:polyphenol oxidase family protein [Rhodoblastus sp. 17X3]|uniref:polyphenol oxidase family protein n=1 Tax=Rhodoblastus sp. 17X3 TaxID=3047026 RepID=UPI0024B75629|nr:polyphenol oxidase family protein [Rhodoblastus sp. 17X3]MDI9846789.1 polyphenol oxidase family protein [Rhodoblastus sp. 17X3]